MPNTPDLHLVAQDSEFRKFHDLMAKKVQNILLVSTAYDAWVMEEDCKLSERIVSEYRGLNLSRPPLIRRRMKAKRATSTSTIAKAMIQRRPVESSKPNKVCKVCLMKRRDSHAQPHF